VVRIVSAQIGQKVGRAESRGISATVGPSSALACGIYTFASPFSFNSAAENGTFFFWFPWVPPGTSEFANRASCTPISGIFLQKSGFWPLGCVGSARLALLPDTVGQRVVAAAANFWRKFQKIGPARSILGFREIVFGDARFDRGPYSQNQTLASCYLLNNLLTGTKSKTTLFSLSITVMELSRTSQTITSLFGCICRCPFEPFTPHLIRRQQSTSPQGRRPPRPRRGFSRGVLKFKQHWPSVDACWHFPRRVRDIRVLGRGL
jgi:hypothetical protein